MKHLYYLEFAQSVDGDNILIPAKNFKWFTPDIYKIAYQDIRLCDLKRLKIQQNLNNYVVRVTKANLFKHIDIILHKRSYAYGDSWTIIKG